MPLIKKILTDDWITDPVLVEAFLERLRNVQATTSSVDISMAQDMLSYVKEHGRYSLKQLWAIAKLEDRVQVAEAQESGSPDRVDWFDTPPDVEGTGGSGSAY